MRYLLKWAMLSVKEWRTSFLSWSHQLTAWRKSYFFSCISTGTPLTSLAWCFFKTQVQYVLATLGLKQNTTLSSLELAHNFMRGADLRPLSFPWYFLQRSCGGSLLNLLNLAHPVLECLTLPMLYQGTWLSTWSIHGQEPKIQAW